MTGADRVAAFVGYMVMAGGATIGAEACAVESGLMTADGRAWQPLVDPSSLLGAILAPIGPAHVTALLMCGLLCGAVASLRSAWRCVVGK